MTNIPIPIAVKKEWFTVPIPKYVPGSEGVESEESDLRKITALAELNRIVEILDYLRAILVPRKYTREGVDHTAWEIQFPKGSIYKNGPLAPSASDAFVDNYFRNGKFANLPRFGDAGLLKDSTGDTFKQVNV